MAVKTRGVYILFLFFILQHTALNQLLKLPTLVEHYLEHQQRNHQLGVTDFLCMHYWGTDEDDDDEERDRQLPFKNVDIHSFHYSFVPLAKAVAVKHQEYDCVTIHYPVFKDNYLPEPALSALFRPPRA